MLNEHTLDQLRSLRLDGMLRALEEQACGTAAAALPFCCERPGVADKAAMSGAPAQVPGIARIAGAAPQAGSPPLNACSTRGRAPWARGCRSSSLRFDIKGRRLASGGGRRLHRGRQAFHRACPQTLG